MPFNVTIDVGAVRYLHLNADILIIDYFDYWPRINHTNKDELCDLGLLSMYSLLSMLSSFILFCFLFFFC